MSSELSNIFIHASITGKENWIITLQSPAFLPIQPVEPFGSEGTTFFLVDEVCIFYSNVHKPVF